MTIVKLEFPQYEDQFSQAFKTKINAMMLKMLKDFY